MTTPFFVREPGRVDEPHAAQEYADVLSEVVAHGRPVIVRRNGEDLAAIIPVQHLNLVREILAQHQAGKSAAEINWASGTPIPGPPQSWFDDQDDNPFEPEEELVT